MGGREYWWYLSSTPYQMRYVFAAAVMEASGSKHVLEIGGFKTPISSFFHKEGSVVTATTVDPLIKPWHSEELAGRPGQVLHLRTSAQEYSLRGDEDGLVFLGIPHLQGFDVSDLPLTPSMRVLVLGSSNYEPIQVMTGVMNEVLTVWPLLPEANPVCVGSLTDGTDQQSNHI